MTNRDEVVELADRIEERRRRGEDYELEFELEWGALTDEERDEFMVLMRQRRAHAGDVLEAIEANIRVLQALLVLQVTKAPGMTVVQAVGAGRIRVMDLIETIRSADVRPPSMSTTG